MRFCSPSDTSCWRVAELVCLQIAIRLAADSPFDAIWLPTASVPNQLEYQFEQDLWTQNRMAMIFSRHQELDNRTSLAASSAQNAHARLVP
jgi:hypothetical protein